MLWILLGIFVALFLCGLIKEEDELIVTMGIIALVILVVTLCVLGEYNSVKVTADKQIAVLEQRNEEVVSQIEPLVKQYLEYESNTFKDLKPNADKIIALAQYPNLKGNEFVQTQIKVILENQEKITDLKLEKSSLSAYKLWIFMGE